MPLYVYKCEDCKKEFEVRHSMSHEGQVCTHCDSKNVFKVPSLSIEAHSRIHSSRVGKVVDQYIKDAKQEIKQEKHKLKTREI